MSIIGVQGLLSPGSFRAMSPANPAALWWGTKGQCWVRQLLRKEIQGLHPPQKASLPPSCRAARLKDAPACSPAPSEFKGCSCPPFITRWG